MTDRPDSAVRCAERHRYWKNRAKLRSALLMAVWTGEPHLTIGPVNCYRIRPDGEVERFDIEDLDR